MESYPVETDPEQIVRWLLVERQRGASDLQISAWRFNNVQPIEDRPDFRLGEEEREDMSDEATIAMLEISPKHANDEWFLTISVEDEFRPSDADGSGEEEEEPIDLDTFYLDFIRPGRGTVYITAEVEGPEAAEHLDQLIEAIDTNSHVPDGRFTKKWKVS